MSKEENLERKKQYKGKIAKEKEKEKEKRREKEKEIEDIESERGRT